ncbi:hypothetical protein K2173_013716 [Erythroxylum novogranatense]|uniref:RRM domain-containing protein n=1 Tax=Erythroxylum novogranatense TaxID=1862640 RepID=A0AAV8SAD3_9ROSI|nr:hypothetical protein K2173_013716 [Erythroxylum novogranatense]
MDWEEGKVFVGGIAWDTSEESLRHHFSQYGDVSQVFIMRDKSTGRPRGFGFVVFSDPSLLDRVIRDTHTIDGRTVEAKRALSREEQHGSSRHGNLHATRGPAQEGHFKTRKIFVGGLPSSLTEEEFCQYFENYGHVTDVVVMYDQQTHRPRGFGFITFDTEDAVERVLYKTFHELQGKSVEVKKALPKDAFPVYGGRGGGYQGYGASGDNTDGSDGRMNGNRYMQPSVAVGGYPPYSGYTAASFGYGMPNGGVGYGYGSYSIGGYGSGSTGFIGPAGPYGVPGALRSNQSPATYGVSSYSINASYGATAPWNPSISGNSASNYMGAPASGASGYGSQGYGPYSYGNYGVTDGSYSTDYGNAGVHAEHDYKGSVSSRAGKQQGSGNSYDRNSEYQNEGWKSDPSETSDNNGSGHNGPHSMQAGGGD